MTYILNIETATKNCSVSLSKNGEKIALKEISTEGFSHAENLHIFIQDVVKDAGINLSDLNAVAVSQGPGSYTGLRIGVSAAKGLSYALNIPLIAVDTLEILAHQLQVNNGFIVPMLDARRMEVFMSVYNSNYEKVQNINAEIITPETLNNFSEKLYLVGDGAEKCKEVLLSDKFIYPEGVIYPSANEMVKLSYKKFEISQFENVAYFEPYYLKDFVLTTSNKK